MVSSLASSAEIERRIAAAVAAERASTAETLKALSAISVEVLDRVGKAMDDFRAIMTASRKELEAEFKKATAGSRIATPAVRPRPHNGVGVATGKASTPVALGPNLTGPERELLAALAWWQARGHDTPTRPQVCAIAQWKVTSGHIKNVAGSCRTKGLIDYPQNGHLELTEAGIALAPEPPQLGLIESLRSILTGPQITVFNDLIANGEAGSNEELAQRVGWEPTSGHVKNVLGSLRSLEVIRKRAPIGLQEWVKD
jgi:hypothetical protein